MTEIPNDEQAVTTERGITGGEALELWGCDHHLLIEFMEGPGGAGSFFQAIAEAMRRADPGNLLRLYMAFADDLHGYLVDQRVWAKANYRDQA